MMNRRSGFTLIELLVVIAIVAVLAVTVVLTLNPAELLKQARDSTRTTSLNTLNKALVLVQTDVVGASFGSTSTVYVSIPDSSSTCANLGLPLLPPGYAYGCVTAANLLNTNGAGWVPVNFSALSAGNPLARLPIDPINTTSSGQYFTYNPGGSWELTSLMESSKYRTIALNDGDSFPTVLSIGTTHGVTPGTRDAGLVGYWPFDELTGTTTYDRSSGGRNGALTNGPLWTNASQCKKSGCVTLDGVDDSVTFNAQPTYTQLSMSAWVKTENNALHTNVVGGDGILYYPSIYQSYFATHDGTWRSATSSVLTTNVWHHIALTFDGSSRTLSLYIDGVRGYHATGIGNYTSGALRNAAALPGAGGRYLDGSLDELRIYNRVLAPEEIAAIYNAQ